MLDLAETLDPLLNERMVRLENGEEDDEDGGADGGLTEGVDKLKVAAT